MSTGDIEEARSEASLPCSSESDGSPEPRHRPRRRTFLSRDSDGGGSPEAELGLAGRGRKASLTRTFSK